MMMTSTCVLDKDDLRPENKDKPTNELRSADFNFKILNLIKAVHIVIYNEFADDGPLPTRSIVFKGDDYILRGEIKPM